MTEKANPSINRPAEAFKTAGAIAYGGSDEGFISPSNSPTEISVQDGGIDESLLNAFDETSSVATLDVTIDGGEAFVFGSWIAIDTQTIVTLAGSTAGQTVSVGWNKNGTDDVIVGLDAAFSSASGDADQKIPLFTFDTDATGVTAVTDERSFDQISADSIEQGAGSGLDADTVDGIDSVDLGTIEVLGDNLEPIPNSNGETKIDELVLLEHLEALGYGDGLQLRIDSDAGGDNIRVNNDIDVFPQGAGSALDADTVDGLEADAFVEESGDTMTGDLDMGGVNTVTNLDDPSNNTDAATKAFVESVAQGLTLKDSVRVSNHDTNIDLSSTTDPNPIDGLTLNDGDRILLKHQTDLTENGIYDAVTATDPTTWVRSPDFDEDAEVVQGAFTFVRGGTHANESYVVITPDPITVGTDDIEFAQFSAAGQLSGGQNISVSGDVIDVSPQGSGSGLDADTLDGTELADIAGGYSTAVTKTADHTAIDRQVVLADATNNVIDITLPSATDGQLVTVKKIDSSNNAVNILTPGAETIDGQSSITLTNQFAARETVSNGANYFII